MLDTMIRLQTVMGELPVGSPERVELISEWLNQLLVPMDVDADEIHVQLASAVDMSEATCVASNNRETIVEKLSELMQFNHLPSREIELLRTAGQKLSGDLYAWMNFSEAGQRGGWLARGVMPLADAWEYFPEHESTQILRDWYAKFGVTACVAVGRSAGPDVYGILRTELSGDSVGANLQLYRDIMERLSFPAVPDPLLEMLADDYPDYVELIFWIGEKGILKAGLVAPEPSQSLVIESALILGKGHEEELAALEGTLGVAGPDEIELSRLAAGLQVQTIYQL